MGVSCICFESTVCVWLAASPFKGQANLFVCQENIGKLNFRPDSSVRVIN